MAITKVNNDLLTLDAAQPTITTVGTLTGFTSTGIDDNATSTAMTITSDEKVGIGINQPTEMLEIYNTSSPAIQLNDGGDYKSIMRLAGNDLEIRGSSGSLEFYTGSADGDSSTQRLTIDSGGNVGIGVTPAAFNAASTAVQLSGGHFYDRTIGETYIGNNSYHDSGDVTRAVNTGLASNIGFYSGNTVFQSAASVAAGALSTMVTNMKIDASGRVSIGRSSDVTAKCLELQPPAQISDFGSYILNIGGDEADDAVGTKSGIGFGYTSTARPAAPATIGYETKNTSGGTYGDLYFATRATSGTEQPTERMSIDSNGNILSQFGSAVGYGQTSGSGGMCYRNEYGSAGGALIVTNDADTGWSSMYLNKFDWSSGKDDRMMQFSINGNGVGYIRSTSSGTSFVTSSDYRLKENVVPMIGSIDRVKALKPSRFNFIADADTTVDGFLAHEAQEVVPECCHRH